MIILGIFLAALFVGITWAFMHSAEEDAKTWTGFDTVSHPYSTRTKVLCIVWFFSVCALVPGALACLFGAD